MFLGNVNHTTHLEESAAGTRYQRNVPRSPPPPQIGGAGRVAIGVQQRSAFKFLYRSIFAHFNNHSFRSAKVALLSRGERRQNGKLFFARP